MKTRLLGEKLVKKQQEQNNMLKKQQNRKRRHKRVRAKIKGTNKIPRLCVFRSNKHIYAQLIDDEKRKIILTIKDNKIKKPSKGKTDIAKEVGKLVAAGAIEAGIKKVVFDRGGYKYHGRVKALAEAVREQGLKF